MFSSANGNAITVADPDSNPVTTTLSVLHGTLTLGSTAGVTVTGNGTGSVQVVGSPAAINAALNGLAYVNTPDYNGPDTLTVATSDGVQPTATSTVGITVTPVVDIANDSVTTNEDQPVTITVNANDSFENSGHTVTAINGTAIAVNGSVAVANGTVTLNADGTLRFVPTPNYNNAVATPTTFSYTVSSGGVTETATVSVVVSPVNDPVVGVADAASAVEAGGLANGTAGTNPSGNVLTNDTDIDAGDTKAVSAVSGVAAGVVGGSTAGSFGTLVLQSNGSYTYTVNNNLAAVQALRSSTDTLTDTFSYTVRDTAGAISTTTLTVTIQGANDAPVAVVDTATAVEAGGSANGTPGTNPTGNVLTNDTDVDAGDSKTVSAVSGAAAGTVGGATAGTYGTLTLNADGSYGYAVDNSLAAVQALRTAANTLTDTFSYTVRDAAGALSTTTLTVTIQGANDAPVATVDTATIAENGTVVGAGATGVLNNDTDVDAGDTKTVTAVAFGATNGAISTALAGTYGTLTLNADGSYTYVANRPAAEALGVGQTGTDVFTYTMRDTAGATSTATLTLTVNGANDGPVAVVDTTTAVEAGGIANGTAGTNPSGNVLANDTDVDTGDTKTVTAIIGAGAGTVGGTTNGTYGTLTLNADGSYTYAVNNANATVQGLRTSANTLTDTFSYTMRDTAGATSTATLTVTIRGANDAPVAVVDTAVAVEAGGIANGTAGTNPAGNVLTNDTDVDTGDTRTVSAVSGVVAGTVGAATAGQYGSLVLNSNGTYTYTVNNALAAVQALRTSASTLTDTFTYTVTDTAGATSTTTLTVTVQGANDTPVATNDTAVAVEAGGTLNGNAGINPAGNVLTNDTDVDAGDTKAVSAITGGTVGGSTAGLYGTLALNADGSYTYTVNNNAAAVQALRGSGNTLVDNFTYTVRDTAGATSTATLAVTVQGANDAPVGVNDTATATEAGGIGNGTAGTNPTGNVLTNDTDVDAGDTKAVSAITGAAAGTVGGATAGQYGSLTLNADGSYTYTVDQANATVNALRVGQSLTDTFTYTVRDTAGLVSTATLVVTVQGANDAPVVTAATVAVSEEGLAGGLVDTTGTSDTTNSATVSGTLAIADPEGDAVTAIAVTAPAIALTSNGVAVTWASSTVGGVQTLTASAGATTVGTLAMNTTTGAYTFTLNAPIDHAGTNIEDFRALSFGVTATAGGQTSALTTLTVNVEDDAPNPIAAQVGAVAMIDTNLEIVLDVSGSMSTTDGVGGQTRLQSAIQSIQTLLDKYDEFGNVAVKLVTFSTNAQSVGTTWTTVANAKTQLAALAAAGGTNYDEALGDAITAFNETGKIAGAQNIAYFFTDGLPTFGSGTTSQLAAISPGTPPTNGTGFDQSGTDVGIQAAEEALWRTFLENNQVKSFAIAFGAGVPNTQYLDPIAYDGQAMSNTNGTLVASFGQLDSVLAGTVQNPVGGQLVSGGLITAGGAVGADGGYIRSITIEGTTYTYNPAGAGSITVTGTNRGTFDTATNTETVTTLAGGQFIIDMDNGVYSYKAPPTIGASIVQTMDYVVTDRDGDTQASTITVNVDRTNVLVGSTGVDTLNGVAGPDLLMGRDGDDTLNGNAGNDQLLAGNGNDILNGGIGNDTLAGGAGTDTLNGGDGVDRLIGGAGNDTLRGDAIAGPLASDTFAWQLADRGTGGAPASDTIQDFSLAPASANGDVIDLRDLLVAENTTAGVGNLQNYLDFDTTSVAGSTVIRISSTGGFASGTYSAAAEDQRITLTGVDLRTGLGLASNATDNQIIQELLTRQKLVVDA